MLDSQACLTCLEFLTVKLAGVMLDRQACFTSMLEMPQASMIDMLD